MVFNAETQSPRRNAENDKNCRDSAMLCDLRVSAMRDFYQRRTLPGERSSSDTMQSNTHSRKNDERRSVWTNRGIDLNAGIPHILGFDVFLFTSGRIHHDRFAGCAEHEGSGVFDR